MANLRASRRPLEWVAARLDRRRFLGGAAGLGAGLAGIQRLSAAAVQGGKVTFAMWQSPDSLDPAVTGLISAGYVLGQVFDPLVWYRPGLVEGKSYFPGLAESWEISADVKTYTFHLRQGVKFHDGTPFTAAAVKTSFDHIVNPATKSRSAVTALGPYDHTEVVDDYTATIVFKEPNAAFLDNSADTGVISSPTALQKYGANYGQHPVGTGPFMFKEWVQNDHVTIVRNPNFAWGTPAFNNQGPSYLDQVTFRIIPDDSTRVAALKTGEVDIAENLAPQDITALKSQSGFTIFNASVTGMPYAIMVNAQKAPTDDLQVRQALEFATDQEAIVAALFEGVYEPSHNVFLPPTLGYDPSLDKMYQYNPTKAGALLDAAGWKLNGKTREKNGQPLKLNFINIANYGFDDISQLMQAQFQALGIQTDISAQSFPTVGDTYNRGDHNLADFFYYAVDPYFMRALYACDQIAHGFNWMHYCNPALDSLVQEGNATSDDTKRAAIYAQAAKIAMEAAVVIPIYQQRAVFVGQKHVSGLAFSVNGMPYFRDVSLSS